MSLNDKIKFELENGEVWFDLATISENLSIPQKKMLLDYFMESDEIANHFINLFKGLLKEKYQSEDFMRMYQNIIRGLLNKFPKEKIVIYDIVPYNDYFEIFYTFTNDNTKSIKLKDEIVFKI